MDVSPDYHIHTRARAIARGVETPTRLHGNPPPCLKGPSAGKPTGSQAKDAHIEDAALLNAWQPTHLSNIQVTHISYSRLLLGFSPAIHRIATTPFQPCEHLG